MPRKGLRVVLVLALTAGCAGPDVTIQDIMKWEVDPAAKAIWGAVRLESDAAGTREFAPRTDAEWAALKAHAGALIGAAGQLAVPRKVARAGAVLADASFPGNLKAPDIETGIGNDLEGFARRASGLREAAEIVRKAIEARNTAALAEAGEVLNSACAACHDAYWYPNAVQPVID